ncbi:iron transporter [Phenylobacterium sp. LjRoot164]|uniref:hypothetical protein n=1 Tax=unclassified Phenylobacterium TaxID=2640670 RepID=UPI003ECEE481
MAAAVKAGAAYRLAVAWRALLSVVANYGLCALAATALARLLPLAGMSRVEAAVTATLITVLAMPVVPIFVFAAKSAWKPTLVMTCLAAALWAGAWLAGAPA